MLNFVLGRAGSGKTEYAFSLIKKLVNDGEDNILLITPEQFSFVCERRLLSDLGESKVNCVENGSFSRLTDAVNKKYGGGSLPILSKGAKAVLFKKAIESVKDELNLFSKSIDNTAFINSMIRIYDEMKSCRVSCDDILNASKATEKEILSQKLIDIAAVINAYDKLIEDKYLDSANELTRLYNRLIELDYFVGKTVIIDSFTGFVAQEYKIIEVILKQAKDVYITFCTDSFNGSSKYGLFSYVNSNVEILKGVAQKVGVKIAQPIILQPSFRYNNEELANIEKYAFSNYRDSLDVDCENIKVYSAKNLVDECDKASLEISKLLRQGVRAKDIAIVCRDLEKYRKRIELSFDKFNIPYYNDERQDISSQPLVMFVNFLLRTVIYSFRSDDIFSLVKTGLTELTDEQISDLENYAYLWNINGSKWKKDFCDSTKGFVEKISDDDKTQIEAINNSREYLISKLQAFSYSVKKKTPKDICKAIYYTLIDFSADKNLKELAVALEDRGKSALALEQERVWDLLMDILDKLATVGGDEEISIKEFYELFNIMMSCEDLGALPSGLDNVQIGSADRMRYNNPYAVFILGANEGEFPQNVLSSGLLTESDRVALIKNDFKIYSYGETLNAQERFFAYNAMSAPTDKLYVSYRNSKDDGAYSSIISDILTIYPNIKIDSYNSTPELDAVESRANAFEMLSENLSQNDEFIASLRAYFSNQPDYANKLLAIDGLSKNTPLEIKDKQLAKKLFNNDIYLSASRIEDYYNCAFRYFCKFGLNARPRVKAEMDPMQTGTVIHYVLEQIIKDYTSVGLSDLSDADIKAIVDKILAEYLSTKMGTESTLTTRFKYQFMNLSKMITLVVIRLREEFAQSDFEAKAFELKIGDGKDGEPVKSQILKLDDGGSIRIKGSIDRVDTFDKNGVKYVRVVDYKSGTKTFKLSDILNGINLQMFIYLFSLTRSDHELSGVGSGVLYMHSAREIYSLNRNSSEKEISSKDNSNFKMMGVVLNDEEHEIAECMEHELEGKYIPVKLSKKNGLTGNLVSLADLGRISAKIDELLKEMGAKLHNGSIDQNPINGENHDKTCQFCDYADVCKNRKELTNREMIELSNEETLEMLKEEWRDA